MYRVNLLRPLTALLAEQNMVGWRVLLQVTCLSSIHIFGDEKPNVKSVSVLLNCLQCALEDSSTKPDASKLALRALLRPASIPVTSDESTTLSFDLFDAIQKVFAEAPLVSLVRLMETPESFEHEFHRWRTGESVVPLLETDRRTAAGVKALEVCWCTFVYFCLFHTVVSLFFLNIAGFFWYKSKFAFERDYYNRVCSSYECFVV